MEGRVTPSLLYEAALRRADPAAAERSTRGWPEAIAEGLLAVRVALRRQFDRFEKQVRAISRSVRGARR
jgi:hypothetical protein